MTKLTDAASVADQIPDGCTLAFPGNLTIMVVDDLLKAVEERFARSGHPSNLTVFEPCNATLGPGTGIERLAHRGLLKRLICAAFPTFQGGRLAQLIQDDAIEAYNFPMGVLYSLTREIGAGRPGVLTEVGLDTFVDPTQSGGKLNASTREDMVERHVVGGRDLLFYKAFPIDVVFLKATTADADGNLSIENEPLSLGALSLAIAAKSSGGKVFAQVERVVPVGDILAKSVLVPGAFVDGVVLRPTRRNPACRVSIRRSRERARRSSIARRCPKVQHGSFLHEPPPCFGRVGLPISGWGFPLRRRGSCVKPGSRTR